MSMFIYNKKSLVLERRADFRFASQVLMVQETMDYLSSRNDSFRLALSGQNVLEFDSFEKIFKKKSSLMGLGSHKILDFLSLSLNVPMFYHPHSIYTTNHSKYSISLSSLLTIKDALHTYSKSD